MVCNQLCLNADKTHILVGGTSQKLKQSNYEGALCVKMNGLNLGESVDKFENVLGVFVQPNLKWTKHCAELQIRLKVRLNGLRKLQMSLKLEKRKMVAQAIFQSVLTYCISVWGGAAKREIDKIQILQNTAAQFVLKLPGR